MMSTECTNQTVPTTKWASTKWASTKWASTKWATIFTLTIIGILFVVGLSIPQESEAGTVARQSLLFQSPIGNPALTIDKTADNTTPQPGDIVNYTISYANTNLGSQAFNVRLYDFLPAGVQYITAVPLPVSSSDGTLLFTVSSVGPTTATTNINVQVRVLPGYARLLNQALVTADGVTPTTDSLLITTLPGTNHLTLDKEGDLAALAGGAIEYTLHCENTSPVTYRNIELLDVLPTGATLVNATILPAENTPPLLKWTVGTLAPGDWWEVTLVTTVPANVGVITNTASLYAPTHTPVQALWATEVISEGVILRVDKTGSADPVSRGDPLIYTLTYQNIGTASADVVLTDTLPTDVVAVGAYPAPTTTIGQQWKWEEIPTLGPGMTGTIVITTTVGPGASGTLHNHVDIGAPGAWGDSDDLYTSIGQHNLYLPLILRVYTP
ncbi:MAG: DUF11 domain-containing protein [Anaerolineae bacterium]|nr:DUF11 domain-containing protein [Anaerolineae bacterium]